MTTALSILDVGATLFLWGAAISYLTAVLGGWFVLARRFRSKGRFEGQKWRFRSGRMRWRTRYGTCLTLGANPTGLYLAVFPILRLGHPPLFIPWSEVSIMSGTKGVFFHSIELRLGRQDSIPLRLSPATITSLKRAAGAGWPAEAWTA